jgi:hypothetical protein
MRQQSFTAEDFEKYRKQTRKEVSQEMSEAVKPHYPAPKGAGRRPIGIERMLRIPFLQHWFELSDPGLRKRYMIPGQCTNSWVLIWPKSQYRMKAPYFSFDT